MLVVCTGNNFESIFEWLDIRDSMGGYELCEVTVILRSWLTLIYFYCKYWSDIQTGSCKYANVKGQLI